jgi:hypothetical protein
MATPIHNRIIWNVLECAKANDDAMVIAACRRLIVASRLGWKRHAEKSDIALVWEIANA